MLLRPDMRFQALMPDVLHWLGIKKIDNMISMSDLKHDAIIESGIPIHKVRSLLPSLPAQILISRRQRYEIPEDLIPPDSRVEIDAKIHAGASFDPLSIRAKADAEGVCRVLLDD